MVVAGNKLDLEENRQVEKEEATTWVQTAMRWVLYSISFNSNIPVVVVGNKLDLEEKRQVEQQEYLPSKSRQDPPNLVLSRRSRARRGVDPTRVPLRSHPFSSRSKQPQLASSS